MQHAVIALESSKQLMVLGGNDSHLWGVLLKQFFSESDVKLMSIRWLLGWNMDL